MHIITGLLVAKLLKARMGEGRERGECAGFDSPLLNTPQVISMKHHLPGRVRFSVPSLVKAHENAEMLGAELLKLRGVEDVEISAVSGSVLISYDCESLNEELLAAVLVRLQGLESNFSGDLESSLSRELRAWARSLNFAVYQKTGGVLDLRTALFLTLAVMGVKRMLADRALGFPAGFTMLWWASMGLFSGGGEAE